MSNVRPVSGQDLELICRHREEMFREAGAFGAAEDALKIMTRHFRAWLAPRLSDESYFGFIAEDRDTPVAGIGMMVLPWAPHPFHPAQDRRGYILNVFVEPSHRRRKIGELLMLHAEEDLRRRGISFAVLHATEAGRALYQTLDWTPTTEMFKIL